MKKTVCFLQTEWDNNKLLETLTKMTPNRSGVWKGMVGITDPKKADIIVIIDYTVQKLPKNKPKIYIGAHPTVCPGYRNYDDVKNNKDTLAVFDLKNTFGFVEWWLKEDYDFFTKFYPWKDRDLSCIVSNQRAYDYHKRRIKWLVNFCRKYPLKLDLYGRIKPTSEELPLNACFKGVLGLDNAYEGYLKGYWFGKRRGLEKYRHSLEFDMGSSPKMGECRHYFSERLVDSLLMWCMPFYYGGNNIGKYLPENSFRYIDPFQTEPEEVLEIVESNFREKHLQDIAEARKLLLDRYQIWPRIWEVIK